MTFVNFSGESSERVMYMKILIADALFPLDSRNSYSVREVGLNKKEIIELRKGMCTFHTS